MRATVMHGAGDVQIENVPDPSLVDPTDAILRRADGVPDGYRAMADREPIKVMVTP